MRIDPGHARRGCGRSPCRAGYRAFAAPAVHKTRLLPTLRALYRPPLPAGALTSPRAQTSNSIRSGPDLITTLIFAFPCQEPRAFVLDAVIDGGELRTSLPRMPNGVLELHAGIVHLAIGTAPLPSGVLVDDDDDDDDDDDAPSPPPNLSRKASGVVAAAAPVDRRSERRSRDSGDSPDAADASPLAGAELMARGVGAHRPGGPTGCLASGRSSPAFKHPPSSSSLAAALTVLPDATAPNGAHAAFTVKNVSRRAWALLPTSELPLVVTATTSPAEGEGAEDGATSSNEGARGDRGAPVVAATLPQPPAPGCGDAAGRSRRAGDAFMACGSAFLLAPLATARILVRLAAPPSEAALRRKGAAEEDEPGDNGEALALPLESRHIRSSHAPHPQSR